MSTRSGTTELTRLPGLEVKEVGPTLEASHWIERAPQKRLMVVSGRSHPELAQKIAGLLGVELAGVTLKTFADGETYCRFEESVRGADMFIVQTAALTMIRSSQRFWSMGFAAVWTMNMSAPRTDSSKRQ